MIQLNTALELGTARGQNATKTLIRDYPVVSFLTW